MTGCRFTNKAVEDLSGIWHYTCNTWSEKQADRYYRMLLDSCRKLAARPGNGKKYDNVLQGLIGYKANSHIIFYRSISDTEIEIVRVLHSRMDIESRIRE